MRNRIMGFILSIIMVIGIGGITPWSSVAVYAHESISDRMLFDLTSFGIITGNESGDYEFAKDMTRAEFVTIILRMLRYDAQINLSSSVRFSDVDESAWYAPYVYTISALGLVKGYQDGTFRPEEPIRFNEVAKVLVSSLGYSYVAESNGGFPKGYIFAAQNIGVFKGVDMTEMPTRADVFTAVYNALDIDMMDKVLGTKERYEVVNGKTFRNRYTDTSYIENLQRGVGIVEANYDYYIGEPVSNIKADQVQIEGWLYYVGDTDAAEYLGQEVEFYVREEADGTYTIVNIKPTVNNFVIELTENDYVRLDGSELYYQNDTAAKEKSVKLSDNIRYIYNGIPQIRYQLSDITANLGELILIDNDDDREIDIAFKYEYSYVRVKSVKNERVTFKDGQVHMNASYIDIELDNDNISYVIANSNGEKIEFEDIKEDDILSIMSNEYGTFNKIIVSDKVIEGRVTEIMFGDVLKVRLDETEYTVSKALNFNANIGDNIYAYLNEKGRIVDVEINNTDSYYGYVLESKMTEIDKVIVRVLIPGTLTVEYEVNDTDPNNVIRTPYLKGHNSDVRTYELSSGLRKRKDEVEQNRLIKYSINSGGQIYQIDYPEMVGVSGTRVYNGYERTFGGRSDERRAFATDDKTKIICVPRNEVNSEDDYHAIVDINNNAEYTINGYDMDDDTKVAKLVVITENMDSSSVVTGINLIKNKMAVVSSIRTVLDEDETAAIKLSFYTNGAEKSYKIGPSAKVAASRLKFGDVFYYTLSPLNEIGFIRLIGSFSPKPALYTYGNINNEMTGGNPGFVCFGRIENMVYRHLLDAKNKFVDIATISYSNNGDENTVLEIDVRNTPAIYIADMKRETVTVGSREDLVSASPSREDYVFVHASLPSIRGIVLYRY